MCARVCVSVAVWWEQISFEHLIWNKVAREASRAVILFPDVCDQHL